MIPIKISLQNFLSYRNDVPPLNLAGIHLACLCGSNGHGKSALLDAVTWALWGSARGKSQDELIHFGQDEMWVELEFMAREAQYRVVRRHSRAGPRGRQGASDLQLQILSDNGFQPITGNSIRDTQAKIQQIISMDYDTFINSAFLIQGRADEFTNKSPGDRKEILSKIMGLGLYDKLQDQSRRIVQEKKRQADDIEATLGFIQKETAQKDEHQQNLGEVNRSLEGLLEQIGSKRQQSDTLSLRVRNLLGATQEIQDLESQVPRIESEVRHLHDESRRQSFRIEEYRKLVNSQRHIEEGYQQYQTFQQEYEELHNARTEFDRLSQQATRLQKVIGETNARLEEQARVLGRRLEVDLNPKAKTSNFLESELGKIRLEAEQLSKEEEGLNHEKAALQKITLRVTHLEAARNQLKSEGEELRYKLTLLDVHHQGAVCPLCDTLLGEEGCQRLAARYQAQITDKRDLYRKDLGIFLKLQGQKDQMGKEFPHKETTLREKQGWLQRQLATLERDLEESRQAAAEADTTSLELSRLQIQLRDNLHASHEQAKLQEVERKIHNLQYSAQYQHELYQKLQENQPYQQQFQRLKEVLDRLPQEEQVLSKVMEMEQHRQKDLANARERLLQMVAETQDLPIYKSNLEIIEATLSSLRLSQQELLQQKGSLEGKLKNIEDLERQSTEKTRRMATFRDEEGVYQELAQAFSRQGLQALLIETVLPRIEEKANEMLARMTDGRMSVKLETQRELRSRKGEYAETLEIKISDEVGPRSYEMFSGGEAFRINLALRIALSKVLALRNGAPLSTLFIDEGFGTQDTAGRERILDVIRAIEQDFERIIVITHLEELKEAFPVRIEVEKRDGASFCWVS